MTQKLIKIAKSVISAPLLTLYAAGMICHLLDQDIYAMLLSGLAVIGVLKLSGFDGFINAIYSMVAKLFSGAMLIALITMAISKHSILTTDTVGCLMMAVLPWALCATPIGLGTMLVCSGYLLSVSFGLISTGTTNVVVAAVIWAATVIIHLPAKQEAK